MMYETGDKNHNHRALKQPHSAVFGLDDKILVKLMRAVKLLGALVNFAVGFRAGAASTHAFKYFSAWSVSLYEIAIHLFIPQRGQVW